jgi:hypothetical protein
MGKAKIRGLIIDRREVGEGGAFDALTDEELIARATKKARELGIADPRLGAVLGRAAEKRTRTMEAP